MGSALAIHPPNASVSQDSLNKQPLGVGVHQSMRKSPVSEFCPLLPGRGDQPYDPIFDYFTGPCRDPGLYARICFAHSRTWSPQALPNYVLQSCPSDRRRAPTLSLVPWESKPLPLPEQCTPGLSGPATPHFPSYPICPQ